jgi:hypothetical protein
VKLSERSKYHNFEQQLDGSFACVKADGTKLIVDGVIPEAGEILSARGTAA